ncbi:MAG TPA: hypothetical protein PLW50_00290 [Smithellaceae bacterium]|nr:hypothetical protein [Smithellaceae bacterium]
MAIKLITYSRMFFPFVWGSKLPVAVAVYLVMRGDKLLKRSFMHTTEYNSDGFQYAEIDALHEGLSWIIANVDNPDSESVDVVFCGATRVKVKNNIENGTTFNEYKLESILDMISKLKGIRYSVQGKIISDDPVYDLYGFSTRAFEMYYGSDNGFTHDIFDMKDPKHIKLVGEPEMWLRNGFVPARWI